MLYDEFRDRVQDAAILPYGSKAPTSDLWRTDHPMYDPPSPGARTETRTKIKRRLTDADFPEQPAAERAIGIH